MKLTRDVRALWEVQIILRNVYPILSMVLFIQSKTLCVQKRNKLGIWSFVGFH